MGREGGQQVVDPAVNGREEAGRDPAVRAVRRDEDRDGIQAEDHQHDEDGQQPVAEPFYLFFISKAVFLAFATSAEPGDDVLEHAERADYGAVHPAEQQGQDDQEEDHADVQRQHGRQQLDLGHPAEPEMNRSRKVEEKQGNQDKKQPCQDDSDFS